MIRVALRGLAGRKLRSILTALAIVLGVAMISGTYVLTDTIDKAFSNLFNDSYAGTDAVVSGRAAFETDFGETPPIPEELLAEVRAHPKVAAAVGAVEDEQTRLVDRGGEAITGNAPTFAFGIDASEPRFNPLRLTAGRWPAGSDEIVIDAGTASKEEFGVGDRIGVSARGPVQQFEVVGIAKFGTVDSLGSATFAIFDVPTAQALLDKEGQLDGIQAAGTAGVTPEELVRELRAVLPAGVTVQTGVQEAADESADVAEFTSFIEYFLLAFGGIALFVGAFVIFNTLSITVAQRVREFATLRTLGASRRQVLSSVVVEALVIGLVASATGLFLGLGLALGLNEVFEAFELDLPQTGTVFATRTVVVSLVVGTAITVLAGLFPAIRATRVPPIAAVREGAVLPRSRLAPLAPYAALLTAAVGLGLLLYGMFAGDLGVVERLASLGVGCLVLFLGVGLVSSRLVGPLAAVLGMPAARLGGAAGRLARENAVRNPGRTAATAAALMIGLALVVFVGVLGEGLRVSNSRAIEDQLETDYVVTSEDGFTPFAPAASEALAAVPGARATGVRADFGKAFGDERTVTGVDPATIASVYRFEWRSGSDDALAGLGDDGAVVDVDFAGDHGLRAGDSFRLQVPSGDFLTLRVVGTHDPPVFYEVLGDVTISAEAFDRAFDSPNDLYAFVDAGGGATRETLAAALEPFPDAKLQTQQEFKDFQEDQIGQFLTLLYVLLALSVIVSLFGIVNTLVLSVFERTREIGMLRAVGMTRRQTRRMVRHESVITALIGAALGIPLGLLLAALVTRALAEEGLLFSVPVLTVAVFAIVAVVAGLLAAILPARRAARLNVLNALQYE